MKNPVTNGWRENQLNYSNGIVFDKDFALNDKRIVLLSYYNFFDNNIDILLCSIYYLSNNNKIRQTVQTTKIINQKSLISFRFLKIIVF